MLASGNREWGDAAPNLIGDDFCSSVEDGTFADRMDTWR
jgi:hypothetical protein